MDSAACVNPIDREVTISVNPVIKRSNYTNQQISLQLTTAY